MQCKFTEEFYHITVIAGLSTSVKIYSVLTLRAANHFSVLELNNECPEDYISEKPNEMMATLASIPQTSVVFQDEPTLDSR